MKNIFCNLIVQHFYPLLSLSLSLSLSHTHTHTHTHTCSHLFELPGFWAFIPCGCYWLEFTTQWLLLHFQVSLFVFLSLCVSNSELLCGLSSSFCLSLTLLLEVFFFCYIFKCYFQDISLLTKSASVHGCPQETIGVGPKNQGGKCPWYAPGDENSGLARN